MKWKEDINNLKVRLEWLWTEMKDMKDKKVNKAELVTCEVCGCLVEREKAIKGKGEIRQKDINLCYTRDYIYYPWYCKSHAPKSAKKKK